MGITDRRVIIGFQYTKRKGSFWLKKGQTAHSCPGGLYYIRENSAIDGKTVSIVVQRVRKSAAEPIYKDEVK